MSNLHADGSAADGMSIPRGASFDSRNRSTDTVAMRNVTPNMWKVGVALVCAMLFGCAQMQRVPEHAPAPATPTPAESSSAIAPSGAPAPRDTTGSKQQRGRISLYGAEFAGRKTASGEPFDPGALTMAHRSLPFGTRVRVTTLENQRSVEVVVNDRGPFVPGRIADLSEGAARRIDMIEDGVVEGVLDIL